MTRQSLWDYSEAERAIINNLHARDFADMTKDEAILFAEWTATQAIIEADISLKREEMEKRTQAAIEQNRLESAKSLETLEALAEQAKAKLRLLEAQEKAVNDGQA